MSDDDNIRLDSIDKQVALLQARIGQTMSTTGPVASDPQLAEIVQTLRLISEQLRALANR